MERVMIFIDGSNFYYGILSLNHKMFEINKFNFYKLGKKLCGDNKKIIRIFYYNAPLNQEENKEKYKAQQKFFEWVKNLPEVSLILCKMQKRWIDKKKNEYQYVVKGDDIHIAVDMVKLAYNDAYDTAIIISGDGDFVPAVKAVQEKGKRVEHAYFKIGHSWFLKQTCNKSILMDENLIKDCFG